MRKYLLVLISILFMNSSFASKYSYCHIDDDDKLNFSDGAVGYYVVKDDEKMESIASKLFGSEILKNSERLRKLNMQNGFRSFFNKGDIIIVPMPEVEIGYNVNRLIVFNDCQIEISEEFPIDDGSEEQEINK